MATTDDQRGSGDPEARRIAETERIRDTYDRAAHSRSEPRGEGFFLRGATAWLRDRARGETLEIGIGRGRTLPAYGPEVRLTGIELSDAMLGVARRYAREIGVDARLIQGDAQDLPFADETFDTVVFSLVLCTIPDDRLAVTEAIRVLRAGGRLLWVEHVRSPRAPIAAIERALDGISMRREGDHLDREPLDLLRDQPVTVEALERRRLGIIEMLAARKAG